MPEIPAAEFQQCDVCQAPMRRPVPDAWSMVQYRIGRRRFAQLHLPTCPAGWAPKRSDE